MTNITQLFQDFTKTVKYQSSGGLLSTKNQSELMGPAILIADLVNRNKTRLLSKESISVAWLSPSGIELVDDSAWINTASNILNESLHIKFHFIGDRKPATLEGPNPNAAKVLQTPTHSLSAYSELASNQAFDLIIVGHNQYASGIAKWKSDLVDSNPDAVVALLAWSETDEMAELIKWKGVGYQPAENWEPNYSFESESEFGSSWAKKVSILEKSSDLTVEPWEQTTLWSYAHSVNCGLTNPFMAPMSPITGIKFLKGGDDLNAIYLVDRLVLIPSYNMLVDYDFNNRMITPICSIAESDIAKFPEVTASFKETYSFAAYLKLMYIKLNFESRKEDSNFIEFLTNSFISRTCDAALATQLCKHFKSAPESAFKESALKYAIDLGSVEAHLELSSLYRDQQKEPGLVIELLKEANRLGSAEAAFNLSILTDLFPEFFSAENGETAFDFIHVAAKRGFPEANYQYGAYLLHYSNPKWGMEHLETAALFGHAEAVKAILETHEQQMRTKQITKKKLERIKRMYRRFKVV